MHKKIRVVEHVLVKRVKEYEMVVELNESDEELSELARDGNLYEGDLVDQREYEMNVTVDSVTVTCDDDEETEESEMLMDLGEYN